MIHNKFFKAKTNLAMVRILTKEECIYNDVPLTEKDFDHYMLKLVYPLFGKQANRSNENSINLQNKTDQSKKSRMDICKRKNKNLALNRLTS